MATTSQMYTHKATCALVSTLPAITQWHKHMTALAASSQVMLEQRSCWHLLTHAMQHCADHPYPSQHCSCC
jgi:hypothetical protein